MSAESSPQNQQSGQTVGARVRAARLARKYTQHELASPDFSVSYISAIERGQIQPSLRALEILAQRLELSTTDLLPTRSTLVGMLAGGSGLASMSSDEWEVLLLEAQIANHRGEPERVIKALQGYIPQKGERRQERAGMICYLLGWAYLLAGRLQESEQVLAEAARQAREVADPFYSCILSLQIRVYMTMHNTEQAAQLQRESLHVLARQMETGSNRFFLARLHSSLAQHYSHANEYELASEQFQQALQILRTQGGCQELQMEYWQLFSSYLEEQQLPLAALYCAKGEQVTWRCQLDEKKSGMEYALGRALLRSDPEQARAYLQRLSQEAESKGDGLSLAGANVQIAMGLVEAGELEGAEQLVQKAREQARPFGRTLISADAQLLAGELAYRRKDYSVGDSCFESGLELLEQIGMRDDLIEHLAHYARLLEERNCIEKALFYFKRAFEHRQENRVPTL